MIIPEIETVLLGVFVSKVQIITQLKSIHYSWHVLPIFFQI